MAFEEQSTTEFHSAVAQRPERAPGDERKANCIFVAINRPWAIAHLAQTAFGHREERARATSWLDFIRTPEIKRIYIVTYYYNS
jgi:hypothetical protein